MYFSLFANGATCMFVYMSMYALEIGQLWHTAGSDFIKTNHQFYIKILRKLHNIFIRICTLRDVLSFNITYVFRQFAGGEAFVYMLPCSQKFDSSRTSSIYFSVLCHVESDCDQVTDTLRNQLSSHTFTYKCNRNVWKRKICWNKWQQSHDSFMKFHCHGMLPVRWYANSIQTRSLASCHHGKRSTHIEDLSQKTFLQLMRYYKYFIHSSLRKKYIRKDCLQKKGWEVEYYHFFWLMTLTYWLINKSLLGEIHVSYNVLQVRKVHI